MEQEFQMNLQNFEEIDINMMVQNNSFIMGQSSVKFLAHDLVVDKKGVKRISGDNSQIYRFQINSKNIIEKQTIGKGSAGQVKRAVYLTKNGEMPIAIKSIPADQKQKRHQLLNDLKTFLNTSDNEYLVQFYGCYFQNGLVKQIIEYMDMGSLRNVAETVAQGKLVLSQKILANIVFKILKGLEYIHKIKHQIHRDIKPENILINSKGQVKITDFGISKYLQMTHNFTMTFIGTAVYMSPQRIQHKDYEYNCDVWSLGLTIYQLATGQEIPYRIKPNQPIMALLSKIVMQNPPSLPSTKFSLDLCNFVSRCLEKDSKTRASVSNLLQHSWITKNLDDSCLKQFMGLYKKLQG